MISMRNLYVVLLMLILAACGGPTVTPDTPPEILYGEDICDQCGMIISDERFAAGVVIETAPSEFEHRIFDDIGGMIEFVAENSDLTIATNYVHDYNSKEWLDAQDAYFIKSDEMVTPMGFGLAACAQKVEAEALAREWHGDVLTFAELQAALVDSTAQSHMHGD